jgi:hypothetical protein
MTCLLGVLGPTILKEARELGNRVPPASVDISAGALQRDGYTFLGVPSNCSAASRPVPLLDPGICSRGKRSIILASLASDPQGARMTPPTKTAYWTLVDEHTDVTMGTRIETITYDAKAPGGKLVRTVTRYREAFVESMVFVPMPPVPPEV